MSTLFLIGGSGTFALASAAFADNYKEIFNNFFLLTLAFAAYSRNF